RRGRAASRPRGSRSASRRPRVALRALGRVQRLEPDEGGADQARGGAELRLRKPEGAAHRLERLAPRHLLGRTTEVVVGGDAEAAAEDDELRAEDVDEGPDAGAEVAAHLLEQLPRLRVALVREPDEPV